MVLFGATLLPPLGGQYASRLRLCARACALARIRLRGAAIALRAIRRALAHFNNSNIF